MANGRSWLPSLPAFLSQLFYGSSQSTQLSTHSGVNSSSLSDGTPLPTNSIERLKVELVDYENNLADHRKKISDISEQVILLQKDLDRKDQKLLEKVPKLSSHAPLSASVKDIQDVIQSIETQEEPAVIDLLANIPEAKDTKSIVQLCDQSIDLIGQLDVGIIKVKGHIQDARDQKTTLHNVIVFLLGLAKLPNLIPSSVDERNDDKLYIAIQPAMNEFFKWLAKVKADLIKAENHAADFLKQQQEKLAENKTVSDRTASSDEKDDAIKSETNVVPISSVPKSPKETLQKSPPLTPRSPKKTLHISVPITDGGGLNITPDDENWGEAGVVIHSPKSPASRPGMFNHSSAQGLGGLKLLIEDTSDSQLKNGNVSLSSPLFTPTT